MHGEDAVAQLTCRGCGTLQEGEVWERGSHAELVAQRGLYAEMWARQAEAARAGNASAESLAEVATRNSMSANASVASLAEDAL